LLAQRPGVFAADSADGRVTLLLSDTGTRATPPGAVGGPAEDQAVSLSALRWLDQLGVSANAAVGYGLGEIAGLVWAGSLSEDDAVSAMATRNKILNAAPSPTSPTAGDGAAREGAAGDGAAPDDRIGMLRALMYRMRVSAPRRRLISATLGREVSSVSDVVDLLCAKLDCPTGLGPALQAGALGASLLVETGPGQVLAEASAVLSEVPAISLGAGAGVDATRAAAALFAVGALEHPDRLYAGRPSRPIDIWREQTFITSPCQAAPHALSHAVPPARRPQAADAAQTAGSAQGAGEKLGAGQKQGPGRKPAAVAGAAASPLLHDDTEPSGAIPSTPLAHAAAMAQRIAAAGLAAAARAQAAGSAPGAGDQPEPDDAADRDSVLAAPAQVSDPDRAAGRASVLAAPAQVSDPDRAADRDSVLATPAQVSDPDRAADRDSVLATPAQVSDPDRAAD